eukprot:Pgem_evm1s12390
MSPNMETNLARKIDNVIPLQHKWYKIRTIDENGNETLSDVVKPSMKDLEKRNIKNSVRWIPPKENEKIFDSNKWLRLNINALNKVYTMPALNIGSALTDEICSFAFKSSDKIATAELLRDNKMIQNIIKEFPNSVIPAYAFMQTISDILKITEKKN